MMQIEFPAKIYSNLFLFRSPPPKVEEKRKTQQEVDYFKPRNRLSPGIVTLLNQLSHFGARLEII